MLNTLAAADFQNLPDHTLVANFGGHDVTLEVAAVEALSVVHAHRANPPFSLLLRHRGSGTVMPQGTYVYRHPALGDLALFTVPLATDADGRLYQIIFN